MLSSSAKDLIKLETVKGGTFFETKCRNIIQNTVILVAAKLLAS